jgi:hypothetical protein
MPNKQGRTKSLRGKESRRKNVRAFPGRTLLLEIIAIRILVAVIALENRMAPTHGRIAWRTFTPASQMTPNRTLLPMSTMMSHLSGRLGTRSSPRTGQEQAEEESEYE